MNNTYYHKQKDRTMNRDDDNDSSSSSNSGHDKNGVIDSIPTMSNEPCPRCAGRDASIWTGSMLETWLACDVCDTWFHAACVGLRAQECDQIEQFHCPNCTVQHGPSIYKKEIRKSQREHTRIDYRDLVNADVMLPRDRLATLANFPFVADRFPRVPGEQATLEWAQDNGLETPVIFTGHTVKGMRMPPSTLTVKDIARLVGHDTPVNVMDVTSQSDVTGWTLANWEAYFSASGTRTRTLNVISLEVSQSQLAEQIERPQLVRDLDWVSQAWPKERRRSNDYPQVQLYCLMSVKDCYTDFHIDFGGSSVFYHILSGNKTFYFIPPTSTNLKKYEKWCKSPEQASTFLAEEARPCYRVNLEAGDTMIIPTGWIHAVYTPSDAIVIEKRTSVPQAFRFPYFEQLCWYAAMQYQNLLHEQKKLSDQEMNGLNHAFINQLEEQVDKIHLIKEQTSDDTKQRLKVKLKLASSHSNDKDTTIPPPLTTATTTTYQEVKEPLTNVNTTTPIINESGVAMSKSNSENNGKLRIRILPQQLRTVTSTHPSSEEQEEQEENSISESDDDHEHQSIHHDNNKTLTLSNHNVITNYDDSSLHSIYNHQQEHHQKQTSTLMPIVMDDPKDEDFELIDQEEEEEDEYDTTYTPSFNEPTRKRPRRLPTSKTSTIGRHSTTNLSTSGQSAVFDPLDVLGLMNDNDTSTRSSHGRSKDSNSSTSNKTSLSRSRSQGGVGSNGSGGVVSKILRDMKRRR
ncbi:hypothetical protein BDF19DRAFT_436610 [Syncephalis fuscata]|nr:hypothetical protein BDF19DRAFT_436610 [Syncephalis fuscata]